MITAGSEISWFKPPFVTNGAPVHLLLVISMYSCVDGFACFSRHEISCFQPQIVTHMHRWTAAAAVAVLCWLRGLYGLDVPSVGIEVSSFKPLLLTSDPQLRSTATGAPELLCEGPLPHCASTILTGHFTLLLCCRAVCLQVHIGFWSGPGNHGKLVGLLDSINGQYCPPRDATKPKQCAAWDEGVDSSTQMPSYVEMLVEQW